MQTKVIFVQSKIVPKGVGVIDFQEPSKALASLKVNLITLYF